MTDYKSKYETIISYGFPEELIPQEPEAAASGVNDTAYPLPARVTAVFKERFQLMAPSGEAYARLKTKEYIYEGREVYPTTGDYVLALPAPGDWQIVRTLPRRSFFSRLDGWHGTEQAVAANMDVVFCVQSLNENFSVKRLERYLTLAWNSGAKPVVVLTKSDLPGDHSGMISEAQRIAGASAEPVPVLALSSRTGEGLSGLGPYLRPGLTAAFLGSSGVGKSSLINALAGEELMGTSAIRERDSMGRHTTTHRQLLRLPSGVLVIDTPGMRELGMWDAGEGLSGAFPDVERLLGTCRFSDCRHENEPGCAILEALESGQLDPERWKSYKLLQMESDRTHRLSTARRKHGQLSREVAKNRRQEKKHRKNQVI